MPYIIDGHNLIPKIPGLSLQEMDDEQHLLEMLQEFCRRQRKQVEVFFDNAPPGGVRARNLGLVTARFVRQGRPPTMPSANVWEPGAGGAQLDRGQLRSGCAGRSAGSPGSGHALGDLRSFIDPVSGRYPRGPGRNQRGCAEPGRSGRMAAALRLG